MKETRLFFVVDSIEDNEEIFETMQEAYKHKASLSLTRQLDDFGKPNKPRVYIGLVRHAYREEDGGWNYDDFSDTFEVVKVL